MALGSAKQICLDSLNQCSIEQFDGGISDGDIVGAVIDALLTYIDDEDISLAVDELDFEVWI